MDFNLADLFECVAAAVPDRVALVCGDRRLMYGELDVRAGRLAAALHALGVRASDPVGVHLLTSVEHVETMLAAYKLRAVPVSLNWRYTAAELAVVAADAGLKAMVRDFRLPAVPGVAVNVGVGPSNDDLVDSGPPLPPPPDGRSGDDLYVLYTGGTTGLPKGVVWRQEDIFFAVLGGGNPGGAPIERPEEIGETVLVNKAQRLGPFLGPDDAPPEQFVVLPLGPLMHASGQWSTLGGLLAGATVVLYDRPSVDMGYVLDLVAREHVVSLNLVGDAVPLLDELDAAPERWDTSSLRLLGSGGALLSAPVKQRLLDALPSVVAITEAIGSSEAPVQGVAVVTRTGDAPVSLRFAARPETAVFDDDFRPVAPGSGVVGRLGTCGRVPLRYHNDPARTDATFVDIDGARWALPGDMATVDADGSIRLLGRGAMCINTGGEKVYPEEVEAAVKTHPQVADAIVVGVDDARWGQRVVAVVVPASGGPPALDALQAHARDVLAGYKVPRELVVVDAIARTAAGKPDYAWAAEVAAAAGADAALD